MGDEAGTVSLEQGGESRYLKSHMRMKEGTILYVQRLGHIRGKQAQDLSEKDVLCLPYQGEVCAALR